MSIIIRNVGGNPLGVSEYEVYINRNLICTFEHNRPDGLAKCLERASKAAEEAKWREQMKFFMDIEADGPL